MEDLKTLTDAVRYFSNPQACIDTVARMKSPDGLPVCPHRGCERYYWLAKQLRWKCANGSCKKQYSVKVGTIFEDSAIALDKWLISMWLVVNCKNGISSYEISRSVGVTQKSAWFMLHRIRLALKNHSWIKMGSTGGAVEVDESFIGGDSQNMHKEKRVALKRGQHGSSKIAVLGMLDRETREVRAKVVPNVKRGTLQNAILDNIVGTGRHA